MKHNSILYMVIPCYNEEEVLDETTRQLVPKLKDKQKEPDLICK